MYRWVEVTVTAATIQCHKGVLSEQACPVCYRPYLALHPCLTGISRCLRRAGHRAYASSFVDLHSLPDRYAASYLYPLSHSYADSCPHSST